MLGIQLARQRERVWEVWEEQEISNYSTPLRDREERARGEEERKEVNSYCLEVNTKHKPAYLGNSITMRGMVRREPGILHHYHTRERQGQEEQEWDRREELPMGVRDPSTISRTAS